MTETDRQTYLDDKTSNKRDVKTICRDFVNLFADYDLPQQQNGKGGAGERNRETAAIGGKYSGRKC